MNRLWGIARKIEFAVAGLTLEVAALYFNAMRHAAPLWRDETSSLSLATKPTPNGILVIAHFRSGRFRLEGINRRDPPMNRAALSLGDKELSVAQPVVHNALNTWRVGET
jgi:hypothetical protein